MEAHVTSDLSSHPSIHPSIHPSNVPGPPDLNTAPPCPRPVIASPFSAPKKGKREKGKKGVSQSVSGNGGTRFGVGGGGEGGISGFFLEGNGPLEHCARSPRARANVWCVCSLLV